MANKRILMSQFSDKLLAKNGPSYQFSQVSEFTVNDFNSALFFTLKDYCSFLKFTMVEMATYYFVIENVMSETLQYKKENERKHSNFLFTVPLPKKSEGLSK